MYKRQARHRSAGFGIAAHAAAEALHQAKRLVNVKPDRRRQRASDRLRAIEALLEIRHRLRFARIVVKFQNRLFRHCLLYTSTLRQPALTCVRYPAV